MSQQGSGSQDRGLFSGHFGFVIAAAGSAVGLGNIWRFPYLTAKYGGGIFLLVYLILMLTFGYAPPHPGMYIKKSCFEKWGYYKHEYRIGADYEMVVRFTRKHKAKRAYMHKCAVAMRLGGASTEKGNAGSFVGNNFDVIDANRENGYAGSRLLVLGKLPMKALELIVPKIFPHIGS